MTYQPGDCIVIPSINNGYIVVYVAGGDERTFHLAFLDYQGANSPDGEYFDNCSFHVATFGSEEQTHVAFDVVITERSLLDNAKEATLVFRLDLGGMIGIFGLTPISEIRDISAYFDQHYAKSESLPTEDTCMPFKRALMPFHELRKRATPINPFPTVKLHKQGQEALQFWQIYGGPAPAVLVVSWGILGQYEGFEEITEGGLNSLKEKYKQFIEEKKLEGFSEYSAYKDLILQFKTEGEWGHPDDWHLGTRSGIV